MCSLLVSNNNKKNIITSGNDERPNYLNQEITIQQIYINFHKKQLFNFLQSDKISVFDKINIINLNKRPNHVNVLNGGLLNNWNFDI
jgi:hypothetical protein